MQHPDYTNKQASQAASMPDTLTPQPAPESAPPSGGPAPPPGTSESEAISVRDAADLSGISQVVAPHSEPTPAAGAAVATPERRRRLRPLHLHAPTLAMPARVHTFDSLSLKNFRLLWVATICLGGGGWLIDVVVGWLTYDLTRSPLLTSLALGSVALPFLFAGPLVGALADAWDRRKLTLAAAGYQAMLIAVFAALLLLDAVRPWLIFLVVLLYGVAMITQHATVTAMVTNVVPRRNLVNAFALNSLAFNATRLVVPALTGLAIAFMGPGRTVAAAVAFYLVAAAAVYAIKPDNRDAAETPRRLSITQLLEGLRFIRGEPVVSAVILMWALPMVFIAPVVGGLMPVFASEVFDVGPAGLGFLVSSMGFGAMTGAVVIASMGTVRHRGRVLYLSLGVGTAAMVGFALSDRMVLSVPLLVVVAGTFATFYSIASAMIQEVTPGNLRGRVAAVSGMPIGLFPVGALLAGGIAQVLGAPTAVLIAACVLVVLLAGFALKFRQVWRLD